MRAVTFLLRGTGAVKVLATVFAAAVVAVAVVAAISTESSASVGSVTNIRWYQNLAEPGHTSECDLTKPIPPNAIGARGLCALYDLQVADGLHDVRFVLKRGGILVADEQFTDAHLYTADDWMKSFPQATMPGTYTMDVYVDGELLGSGSTSPTATPSPSPTASPAPTATPTPTPGVTKQWADADCDGELTTRDNQAILRKVLSQAALSQTPPCFAIGSGVSVAGFGAKSWADADCDGEVTTRDNQALLRKVLSQAALSQTEPCPDVGAEVPVS